MALDGVDGYNFLSIMIDLASSVAIVYIVALLVAVEAFPVSHEFVMW